MLTSYHKGMIMSIVAIEIM